MGGNSLRRRSATNRNWVYQSKLESELRNRVWCSKLNSFCRPTRMQLPLTSLLPPANQIEGRLCFQSCLSVILSGGRSHVTITHDALYLTIQGPPPSLRHVQLGPHCKGTSLLWTTHTVASGRFASYWNAFLLHFINADTITWQYPASAALLLMFLNDHDKIIKFNKFLCINWSWTTDWVLLTCVTRILVEAGS